MGRAIIGFFFSLALQYANVGATTIDFEDGIRPVNNNGFVTLSDVGDFYFTEHGVTFKGAQFFETTSAYPNFGGFAILANSWPIQSSISIYFDRPVSQVSIDEIWYISNMTTSLNAYRPRFTTVPFPQVLWESVDSDTYSVSSLCCGFQAFNLSVTGDGIQRVDIIPANLVFGTSGFNGAMDNLTFTTVPVPAAFPMLAAALGGLGVIRLRKPKLRN